MATIVFDFDSTLIKVESLEKILAEKLKDRDDLMEQLKTITNDGMAGRIDFKESLSKRLEIATPSQEDAAKFGPKAINLLTPGMADLITDLHEKGHQVWIISGGLREAILPVAEHLGIAADRVCAVRLMWMPDGRFYGIDSHDGFSTNKIEGLKALAPEWPRPAVMVGDGMTDFRVVEAGFADHFIAFTGNVRRPAVVDTGAKEAGDTASLTSLLEELL